MCEKKKIEIGNEKYKKKEKEGWEISRKRKKMEEVKKNTTVKCF